MKTAEEILIKVLNECENPNDLDLVNILAKRSLPFMKKAMEEYAAQFIHPTNCYQCEGTGNIVISINPDGQDYTQTCQFCKGVGKVIILPMQQNT